MLASGVLGFVFLIAVTLAAGDPVALAASGTPIADVIKHTLGSVMSTLLLVMVVVAIFACGLVIMMTGVRLTWAMSRDERFPGWQQWNQISERFHTPLKATVMFFVLAELILAAFSQSQNALFTLFGAATLLPAVIYAATVVLYLIKRKQLPDNGKFDLGAWEKPVLIVAVVWLVFELALFRDASFKNAWLYVLVDGRPRRDLSRRAAGPARPARTGDARHALHRRHLGPRRRAGHAMTYVLAIDQGTSGTKAIVVDEAGQVISIAEIALRPDYLPGGGVEQDPEALLRLRGRRRSPRPRRGRGDRVRGRPGQPGRDRPGLGPAHRPAAHPGDRLAGSPRRVHLRGARRIRRHRGRADRAGPGSVLLGTEDGVDPGEPDP